MMWTVFKRWFNNLVNADEQSKRKESMMRFVTDDEIKQQGFLLAKGEAENPGWCNTVSEPDDEECEK
jgi:hypothetical protein